MNRFTKVASATFFLLMSLQGQTQQVSEQPQCVGKFNASGVSSPINNTLLGCNNWQITYENYGASHAITVTFQEAPSNAAGTAPGTYQLFTNAPISGTNPSTVQYGEMTFQGYAPWVRVNVTGLTGSVRGQILGCRLPCSLPSSSGGGGGSSVTVTNFPSCFSESTITAPISVSSSGSTQILGPVPGTTYRVCALSISMASAVNITFNQGNGTACASSTAALSGAYQAVLGLALDTPITLTSGLGFCISLSSAVTGGGTITYVSY